MAVHSDTVQIKQTRLPARHDQSTRRGLRPRLARFASLVALVLSCLGNVCGTSADVPPRLHDDRLELTLYASEPDIVTPIGIAIDSRDRLFVIESHTHMPPSDYPGPKTDWIKIFQDTNGDGQPDRITRFAEGFIDAMNLAFSPDGVLHVVCARDVWRLPDADEDGVCDGAELLLKVETSNYYPHATLLGITFGPDGWLYVSRGNNGSARYVIRGTDASFVEGWGDGGNIIRCRPDGSNVEEFATGFWNPFDIRFDSYGRLLATDNDPDARGPNRLLHIVPHGDYGYRSIHGGGGNHPFQGWDGDLPGSLPYLAGTGEAPSGFIDANRTSLPLDYRDQLLVTVWNENTIHRFVPQPRGATITATNALWMSGDNQFRPVALDADSRGNLFITDWVLVDYPNHGRGRIWRVSTKSGVDKLDPRPVHAAPEPNPGFDPFNELLASRDPADYSKLEQALRSKDPFLRHAATVALSRPEFRPNTARAAQHPDARVRLGALLALQRAQISEPEPFLRRFFADPAETVRRAALIWTGEAGLIELRPAIDRAIDFSELSAGLFETYLAAVELLDPAFVEARRTRAHDRADRLKRKLDPNVIDALIADPSRPPGIRALAMTRLESPLSAHHRDLLLELAQDGHPRLSIEAMRTLGQIGTDAVVPGLRAIALDPAQSPDARAEALLALAWQPAMPSEEFIDLLRNSNPTVRSAVIHLLRRAAWDEPFRSALLRELDRAPNKDLPPALIEQLEFALFPPGTQGPRTQPRPDTFEAWREALTTGGDPVAGARVFYSPFTACASCHLVHNRGGRIGPDLSNIGQSVNREQIIESILRPSEQFAPQWQAWFVELTNGEQHQGIQLDHKSGGDIEMFTTDGVTRRFQASNIADYGVLPNSLMPDGLEDAMTVGEFRDLVAFLEALR